ncbi:MAG: hypothetical protein ABI822_16090, partial [Bryobacteraceae bacterium]
TIEAIQEKDANIVNDEIYMAKTRLISAEKSSIQRSASQGLISMHEAEKLLAEADRELDDMVNEKERTA